MENRRNGWFSRRTPVSVAADSCAAAAATAVFVVAVSLGLGSQEGRFPAGLRLRCRDLSLSGERRQGQDKAPPCCFDLFIFYATFLGG